MVTAVSHLVFRADGGHVALCPELDVASQGESVEQASANLREAVELFLETADPSEVAAAKLPAAAKAWGEIEDASTGDKLRDAMNTLGASAGDGIKLLTRAP